MNQLLWLISKTLFLLVELMARAGLELVGCAVRLLYWSVRTYGWGRVLIFFAALCGSFWLHTHLGWLSFSVVSLASLAAGTFGLWGLLVIGSYWLSQRWHQWATGWQYSRQWTMSNSVPSPAPVPTVERISPSESDGTALWEKVLDPMTLQEAWQRVFQRGGGPGSDGVTVESFALDLERNLPQLAEELRSSRYRPRPPRWVEVPKLSGGMRRLAVLCVRDRIVQQAILLVLSPLWDGRFAPCSYAYRPGRSALQAVAAVEQALASGCLWIVDADIKSFFDSIPHAPLFALLEEWLPDLRLRNLVQLCVATVNPTVGQGLAQGAPLSPLLANLYLHRFDSTLLKIGHRLIRYADDFVILCATRSQAEAALAISRRLLDELDLCLNTEKTRIVHRDEGFTFLGWTFNREGKRPSDQAIGSLQRRLAAASDEPTRRQIVVGWQGYFGTDISVAVSSASVKGMTTARGDEYLPWWADLEMEENPLPPNSDSDLTLYRERFLGRVDVFAQFWQRDGRRGYAPVRRPVTDAELQAHLAGQTVLGTFLLHPDGTTKALVLDIDGPDYTDPSRQKAFQVAQRLVETLSAQGITPLWIDSAGKGYHLWLCFSGSTSAKAAREWATKWLDQFRPFPEGVLVEVFPKQHSLAPGQLGALIRLPFGRHPQTGRASTLLSEEGQAVTDPWAALAVAPLVDPEMLLRIRTISSVPEPPEAIAPVVKGCTMVSSLIKKAAETQHLRHMERLALLYTLGHLGEEGRNYLHQVMALCSNYDPRITERWIQRLDKGHRAIRCAKLREWLKDYLPGVSCHCLPKRANPSPLDLLHQAHKSQPELHAPPDDVADTWDGVAEEMFGEALADGSAFSTKPDEQRG